MKRAFAVFIFACAVSSSVIGAEHPNILFIFSDDQRADTIQALGNEHIQTPNLDKLVQRGTSFNRAFCMGGMQGAVCVPARATLMTGRTLFRIDDQMRGQGTWPESFGKAGYETFAAGKWHNGPPALLRSFSTGGALFLGGMGDPWNLPLKDIDAQHKLVPHEHREGVHAVQIIADQAVEFLKNRKKEKPFLMYVAMEAPHDPRVAPKEYHDKYNAAKPPLPPDFLPQHPFDNGEMEVRDEKLAAWPRIPDEIRQHLADYYASITFMDAQIGRILDALGAAGLDSNTIVVFSSDQGLAIGSHGLMGKQNLYESAMRVPLIIGGPGLPQNKRSDAMCYLLDIFPTLGALAGVSGPDGSEGISLVPALKGETPAGRTTIFTAYKNVQRAVRDERWKLICYPQIGRVQLFDLLNDPNEITDLSGKTEYAVKLKEMLAALEKAKRDYDDKAPLTVTNPKSGAWTPPK